MEPLIENDVRITSSSGRLGCHPQFAATRWFRQDGAHDAGTLIIRAEGLVRAHRFSRKGCCARRYRREPFQEQNGTTTKNGRNAEHGERYDFWGGRRTRQPRRDARVHGHAASAGRDRGAARRTHDPRGRRENSRDALHFAAPSSEHYATSGTRLTVRFLRRHASPGISCRVGRLRRARATAAAFRWEANSAASTAARARVSRSSRRVTWAATAIRGTPLQYVQIVKGWVDAAGTTQ